MHAESDRATGLVFLVLCTILTACELEEPSAPVPEGGLPAPASIVDGSDPEGNPSFFWLAPIATDRTSDGTFDASVFADLVVEIREWRENTCASSLLRRFGRGSGLEVNSAAGWYSALWRTSNDRLDPAKTYRMRVLLNGAELGHADLHVRTRGGRTGRIDRDEFVAVVPGQALPIRFRVNEGALPDAPLAWEPVSSMPIGLRAVSAASDDVCIYALGGNTTLADWTTHNQIYDPSTDRWFTGASFTGARDFTMVAALADGIHMVGGSGPRATGGGHHLLSDHQVYDPVTDSWSVRAPLPIEVDAAVSEEVDGLHYIIGGGSNAGVTTRMFIYDPATDSWSEGPAMPTPRLSPAHAVIDGQIYVAGGQLPDRSLTDAHERFDPTTGAWTVLAPLPGIREASGGGPIFGGAEVDGLFCVFGGRDGDRLTSIPLAETLCYDPASDAWEQGPDMITPRMEPAFVDHGGAIYAIGGWTEESFATDVVERLRRR